VHSVRQAGGKRNHGARSHLQDHWVGHAAGLELAARQITGIDDAKLSGETVIGIGCTIYFAVVIRPRF
jgi:hypothetical protein